MSQDYKQDKGWIDFNDSLPDVLSPNVRVFHLNEGVAYPDDSFFDPLIDVVIRYNDDSGSILLLQLLDKHSVIREVIDPRNFNVVKVETFMWSIEFYYKDNTRYDTIAIPTMSWEDIDKINDPIAAKKKRHYAYDMSKGFK